MKKEKIMADIKNEVKPIAGSIRKRKKMIEDLRAQGRNSKADDLQRGVDLDMEARKNVARRSPLYRNKQNSKPKP